MESKQDFKQKKLNKVLTKISFTGGVRLWIF